MDIAVIAGHIERLFSPHLSQIGLTAHRLFPKPLLLKSFIDPEAAENCRFRLIFSAFIHEKAN